MPEEESACTAVGVQQEPKFPGNYSFNTGYVKPITPVDYILLVATLVTSVLISVYFVWRSKLHMDLDDYLVAGRSMHYFPVGLSLLASFMSAITMIGAPVEIYEFNITILWMAVAYFLMAYIAAHIFVPVFYQLQLVSVYEYLELRFSRGVRTAGSFLFFMHQIMYMAVALYTPSVAFHNVTGLSLWGSLLSVGIVCTIYTSLGGLKAVLWTDSFQLGLMLLSLVVMIYCAVDRVGGLDLVYKSAVRTKRSVFWDFRLDPYIRHTVLSLVVGNTFTHLCIFGVNYAQIQRCLSCRTLKHAKIAVWMNFPGYCMFLYLSCIIGLYMAAFYEHCDPIQAEIVKDAHELFPLFTMDILGDTRGLPGLILAGIFSATLSTVSAGLNSVSAAILEDFVKIYIKSSLKEHQARLISQIISIIIGIICIEITFLVSRMGNVFEATNLVFGLMAAPILGLFSLGLFFPWANAKGAMAGLVCSAAVIIWLKMESLMSTHFSHDRALTCVSNCNSTIFSKVLEESMRKDQDQDTPEYSEQESLHHLSYMYTPVVAVAICIVVGMIVSRATGFQNPQDMDPRLVVSLFDDVFPFHYLPERIKQYSRFGMDHKGKYERTLPERKPSDESNWKETPGRLSTNNTSRRKSHENAEETKL